MSYHEALEAAGATVHNFEQFGSYQGDWWAKVTHNGGTFWVHRSYGSCFGCDAFEAEFGWGDNGCEEHRYDPEKNCSDCKEAHEDYQKRLAEFGATYLDGGYTQQAAEIEANRYAEWDGGAAEVVRYLKENAI